jgi:hypothetical protein
MWCANALQHNMLAPALRVSDVYNNGAAMDDELGQWSYSPNFQLAMVKCLKVLLSCTAVFCCCLSQIPTGLEIVGKVFEFTKWP